MVGRGNRTRDGALIINNKMTRPKRGPIKGSRHRPPDEIQLEILNYLYENGPTGVTELEYAVELNNNVFKQQTKDLIALNMINSASPNQVPITPKRRARMGDNVLRVIFITEQGEKCMRLMRKRAEMLQVNKPYLPPVRVLKTGFAAKTTS